MELNKVDVLVVFWASIMKCARVWPHTDQLSQTFLDVDLGGLHCNNSKMTAVVTLIPKG